MPDFTFYTIDEVKKILKISRRTLYNYINNGNIKAVKIGKYWRIRQTDLEKFIEDNTTQINNSSGNNTSD
jgi:excisionase family DNA binding protein